MLRRLLVPVLLSIVLLVPVLSQGAGLTGKGWRVGVNLSRVTGDLEHYQVKPGFTCALFAEYSFSERLSLQPEIGYSIRGWTQEYDLPAGYEFPFSPITSSWIPSEDIPIDLYYLHASYLFKYKLKTTGWYRPALIGGIEISQLIHATFDGKEQLPFSVLFSERNTIREFRRTYFSFAWGLSNEFPMGLGRVVLDLRHSFGLSDLINPEVEEHYRFDRFVRSCVLSISLGYIY